MNGPVSFMRRSRVFFFLYPQALESDSGMTFNPVEALFVGVEGAPCLWGTLCCPKSEGDFRKQAGVQTAQRGLLKSSQNTVSSMSRFYKSVAGVDLCTVNSLLN